MGLTLTQMVASVLRNVQVPLDTSTSSVQAQTDAAAYINERALDVWKRRLWREYIILGTYTPAASTNVVSLGSITALTGFTTTGSGRTATFDEIVSVRNGSTPLLPEDFGAINTSNPDLWASTTTPVKFVNRGQSGIYLLGQFDGTVTLSFMGKSAFRDIGASEQWILDPFGRALIAGATADMIRDNDRDDQRAQIRYQEFSAEISKLIDAAEAQGANQKRVIPTMPWTNIHSRSPSNISPTGAEFD